MSPWQTMVFPALFTAGMSLIDTTDSVLMVGAYGWAFVEPLRKLWYNLAITGASVAVAALIGGIEALGLIADRLGLERRVLGRRRQPQRQYEQFRLCGDRDFRAGLGRIGAAVPLEGGAGARLAGFTPPTSAMISNERLRLSWS